MGGEKANGSDAPDDDEGSPPRGRGKAHTAGHWVQGTRITPAWAGKRPEQWVVRRRCKDHPRMGGEKILPACPVPVVRGSPPRGRGKVLKQTPEGIQHRITPAWAGKRFQKPIDMLQGMGSPPRGRGKVSDSIVSYLFTRITPAWAGKSLRSGLAHSMFWDHPRVGGEKSPLQSDAAPHGGSPPRGRGKAS